MRKTLAKASCVILEGRDQPGTPGAFARSWRQPDL